MERHGGTGKNMNRDITDPAAAQRNSGSTPIPVPGRTVIPRSRSPSVRLRFNGPYELMRSAGPSFVARGPRTLNPITGEVRRDERTSFRIPQHHAAGLGHSDHGGHVPSRDTYRMAASVLGDDLQLEGASTVIIACSPVRVDVGNPLGTVARSSHTEG